MEPVTAVAGVAQKDHRNSCQKSGYLDTEFGYLDTEFGYLDRCFGYLDLPPRVALGLL